MVDEVVTPKEPENNIKVNEANPFETQDHPSKEPVVAPALVAEVKPPYEEKIKDEKPEDEKIKKEIRAEDKIIPEPKTSSDNKPKTEASKEEIKFANEASKKYYDLITAGDGDKLYDFLHEQRTLSTVDKLTAEQQIKLNLRYQHPDYNEEDIDSLFSESFERPEKPEQAEDELDEEYKAKLAKWEKEDKRYQNKIVREAKTAVKQLSQKKSELILPNIPAKETTPPQPTAEEMAAQKRKEEADLQSLEKGVSDFNGFATAFKDGDVEIPVQYTISQEEKEAFKETLKNFNVINHFAKEWVKEEGALAGDKFAQDVYWLLNREKILQKVASEAANRRLENHLKEQKNIDFTGGRQVASNNNGAVSEQDKMIEFMLSQR